MELRAALESLKAELGMGQAPGTQAGDWRLNRVTVSLAVEWRGTDQGNPTWHVVANRPGEAAGPDGAHRITLEYQLGDAMPAAEGSGHAAAATSVPNAPAAPGGTRAARALGVPEGNPQVKGWLVEMLGEPGFDSSARARVLVEAVQSLESGQQQELLAGLEAPEPLGDEAVERVRHQIRRVLERGPAGSGRGLTLLRQAVTRESMDAVLKRIATGWYTSEWWEDSGDAEPRVG